MAAKLCEELIEERDATIEMHACMQEGMGIWCDKQYRDEARWCEIEILLSTTRAAKAAELCGGLIKLIQVQHTTIATRIF